MRTFIFLLISYFCISSAIAKNPADRILGTYLTDEKDAKVKIFKKGNKYYGKVVWLKNPKNSEGEILVDKNNHNKKLRKRPLLGLLFITGLEYDDGEWVNGRLYGPKEGLTVNGEFKFLPNGDLQLKASYLFITTKRIWKRIK
jgi:uncharacterized protein (DUF2147 family)